MATKFADEIHALTGFDGNSDGETMTTVSYEDHTTQWLSDGAQEIASILSSELQEECTTYSSQTNANGFNVATAIKITSVVRHDGTSYQLCRKVPTALWSRVAPDSGDLLEASAADPVYYVDYDSISINELYIKPDPSPSQKGRVYYIPEYSIDDDDTVIANFPQVAEPAVVLYAAIKALCYKMAEMHTLVPKHSLQDGSYTYPDTDGKNWGWEQVRHWINNEEDSELAGVNAQTLGAEVQQWVAEYQWYQSKHQMLQQEYQQKLAFLSGKVQAPPPSPSQEQKGAK